MKNNLIAKFIKAKDEFLQAGVDSFDGNVYFVAFFLFGMAMFGIAALFIVFMMFYTVPILLLIFGIVGLIYLIIVKYLKKNYGGKKQNG